MKKNKLPNPISILILTLLTAVVWVSLNIYRAVTTKPAPSVPQTVSEALNPTLNQDTINKVESATFLNDSQIPQITAGAASGAPTATPVSLPTALPSASPSAIPSASPSATP
jgi:hypothetical protein